MGAVGGDEIRGEPVSVEWDKETPDRAIVRLCGDLSIGTIEAVHTLLPDVLARAATVAVDAGQLRSVDLAGIQLLIAGRRDAERAGKLFYLAEAAGGALREALVVAGLVADGGGEAGWVDAFWLAG